MNSVKNKIRSAAVGLTVGAVALTGAVTASTVAGAGEASADIANGRYTYTAYSWGVFPLAVPAKVSGNTLITYTNGRSYKTRIHPTRSGGWTIQSNGQRMYLHKQRGRSYRGDIMLGAVPIGHVTLTPRR